MNNPIKPENKVKPLNHKREEAIGEIDGTNEKEVRDATGSDLNELDPYEINFLPQFRHGRGPEGPFMNSQGVVIGDHDYVSKQSPLEHWTEQTDPAVMAGEEWVHPFKDVGFQTTENREYFEQGIAPQSGIFMHPDKNVAYEIGLRPPEGEEAEMDENKNKNTD